ncbi:unnamed protein product [Diabrotica balteata]|uniref:Uncharacterized protein n=1 Tax=Diabrotica balteata TaxID=107213 RepID=A0A9N9SS76_DIABA|nr:unnamed protein product [Diabrotica balteata]
MDTENCRTASRSKRMVQAALKKILQEKISVIRQKTKKPRCVTKDNDYIPDEGESEETETSEIKDESFSEKISVIRQKTKKPRCVTKDNNYIPEKGESEETETSRIEDESFSTLIEEQ